jgi:uncharacterized YigZ family protein
MSQDLPAGSYTTLAGAHQHQEIIKNSEFLAYCISIAGSEQALAWVKTLRSHHERANHVCWAYKIHDQYRFSDDGEPAGTAGGPILRAIDGSGLEAVAVAVVRYFGGVKLGAGGLVRAYAGMAAKVLQTAPTVLVLPRTTVSIHVPFEYADVLYRLLSTLDIQEPSETYTEHGLEWQGQLIAGHEQALTTTLRDATRGRAVVKTTVSQQH